MSTTPPARTRAVTADDLLDVLTASAGVSAATVAGQEHLPLESFGVDSLAGLELQARLADRFGVEIPDESSTMSLDELVRYVNARLPEES